MDFESEQKLDERANPVTREELNSWRRGFTPQAEIWNGRMAMFGLAIAIGFLLIFNSVMGQ